MSSLAMAGCALAVLWVVAMLMGWALARMAAINDRRDAAARADARVQSPQFPITGRQRW